MLTLGLNLGEVTLSRAKGGGVSYLPEATALFARMTTEPDAARKGLINTLIGSLITAGVWAKMDALYVLAAHDAQAARLNWRSAAFNMTAISTPTFTADRGYAGDGVLSHLDCNFNPNAAIFMSQNSCHVGAWQRTAGLSADAGVGGGNANIGVNLRAIAARVRLFSSTGFFPANTGSTGYVVGRRDGGAQELYKNAVSLGSGAVSNSAPTSDLYVGRTGSNYTTQQYAVVHFGSDLTPIEVAAAYDAFNAYLQAIGAA